jgi:hypothetical protein
MSWVGGKVQAVAQVVLSQFYECSPGECCEISKLMRSIDASYDKDAYAPSMLISMNAFSGS